MSGFYGELPSKAIASRWITAPSSAAPSGLQPVSPDPIEMIAFEFYRLNV